MDKKNNQSSKSNSDHKQAPQKSNISDKSQKKS